MSCNFLHNSLLLSVCIITLVVVCYYSPNVPLIKTIFIVLLSIKFDVLLSMMPLIVLLVLLWLHREHYCAYLFWCRGKPCAAYSLIQRSFFLGWVWNERPLRMFLHWVKVFTFSLRQTAPCGLIAYCWLETFRYENLSELFVIPDPGLHRDSCSVSLVYDLLEKWP